MMDMRLLIAADCIYIISRLLAICMPTVFYCQWEGDLLSHDFHPPHEDFPRLSHNTDANLSICMRPLTKTLARKLVRSFARDA